MNFGSFGKEIRVLLSRGVAHASYWHGLLRPRLIDRAEISVPPLSADRSSWQPAIDGLQKLLASRRWTAQRLHAEVGDEFVRYTVLAGLDPRLGTEEIANLAHAMFLRSFGDAASGWQVRVSLAGSGSVVAAAMERALVDALAVLASERHTQLATVQPVFAEQLGKAVAGLRSASWIIVREPGATVLALYDQQGVRSLRVLRGASFSADDICLALEREQRRAGSSVRPVAILGAAEWVNAFPADWQVQALDRGSAVPTRVPSHAVLNGAAE